MGTPLHRRWLRPVGLAWAALAAGGCLALGSVVPASAEGSPAGRPAAVRAPAPVSAPAPVTPLERLSRAFAPRTPREPLESRVDRVRRVASAMGMWSAEAAGAGALLAEEAGDPEIRARAAVRLAPGWPASWGALARAEGGVEGLDALVRGIVQLDRHLAASLWWRAALLHVLAWTLVGGGLLFLLVSALALAPTAAGDLSRRLPGGPPAHAVAGILAALAILPAAFGAGLPGVAAGVLLVTVPWATGAHRGALAAAAVLVWLGLHPVPDATARWLVALDADPAVLAIRDAEAGRLSADDRERLARRAEDGDPAAAHALVVWSKRSGRLAEARRWLDALEATASGHPILLNDAANVHLSAGDEESAIELYREASRVGPRPEIYFNLAQVHGSRIELAEQEEALARAQDLDASRVGELGELREAERLVVDLDWPTQDLRARLLRAAPRSGDVARELRAAFRPGALGQDPRIAAALPAVAWVLAWLLGRFAERPGRSRTPSLPGLLAGVSGLLQPIVPGAAGVAHGRPGAGLVASLAAAAAVACWIGRGGVSADPGAVGETGPAALVGIAALSLCVFAFVTWRSRREAR